MNDLTKVESGHVVNLIEPHEVLKILTDSSENLSDYVVANDKLFLLNLINGQVTVRRWDMSESRPVYTRAYSSTLLTDYRYLAVIGLQGVTVIDVNTEKILGEIDEQGSLGINSGIGCLLADGYLYVGGFAKSEQTSRLIARYQILDTLRPLWQTEIAFRSVSSILLTDSQLFLTNYEQGKHGSVVYAINLATGVKIVEAKIDAEPIIGALLNGDRIVVHSWFSVEARSQDGLKLLWTRPFNHIQNVLEFNGNVIVSDYLDSDNYGVYILKGSNGEIVQEFQMSNHPYNIGHYLLYKDQIYRPK
jgi:hypothetical protein